MGTMMVPSQLGLIGFFNVVAKIGLTDNLLALILPAVANANVVLFVKLYHNRVCILLEIYNRWVIGRHCEGIIVIRGFRLYRGGE